MYIKKDHKQVKEHIGVTEISMQFLKFPLHDLRVLLVRLTSYGHCFSKKWIPTITRKNPDTIMWEINWVWENVAQSTLIGKNAGVIFVDELFVFQYEICRVSKYIFRRYDAYLGAESLSLKLFHELR